MSGPHDAIEGTRGDPAFAGRIRAYAAECRAVFVAGLPGTGKSLVIREVVRAAAAAGRTVHTLQWDVARPAFEASPAGRRYPLAGGVTHIVIRRAAGLWVRGAVARWDAEHPGADHLLIGELPLVGGRFIELARPEPDAAEALLAGAACRFVIPVPSREVRAFVEAERDRRMARPLNPREREDAPSHVLRALWQDLAAVARTMAIPEAAASPRADGVRRRGEVPYDPALYEAVYRRVLSRRHTDTLPLTRVLETAGVSAYDLGVSVHELRPSPADAAEAIRRVEARYASLDRLATEMDRWYDPSPAT